MKTMGLVLSTILFANTALAETIVWRGTAPTAHVFEQSGGIQRTINCYPVILRDGGKLYRRTIDCPGTARGFSDIAVPLDGCVNRASCSGARHVRVLRNGVIQLF